MPGLTMTALPAAIVKGLAHLEPLPITAQRLIDMVRGNDVALAQVAELIELDPVVTASVLRHASSVRLAPAGAPTVREAVLRMGAVALLDLVLEGYLAKLRVSTPVYHLNERDLWIHGAASKLAVRALAAAAPRATIPPMAETAALLHDVGKLLISRCLNTGVHDLAMHARTRGLTFVEAERDLLGTDHAAVGAAMADAWRFPPEVTDAIRRHHSPPFFNATVTLDAVCVANVVAKTIAAGSGAEGLNVAVDPLSYRRLGLDFVSFGRVCLLTDAALCEVSRAHGIAA